MESPDKKYVADAFDITDCYFFSGEKSYYEFTVKSAGKRLRHVVFDIPGKTGISWREEGIIRWATNTSSVTFTFKGSQLTLSV